MERRPPQYELAREVFLAAAEADKANMRPRLDIAELEFAFWLDVGSAGAALELVVKFRQGALVKLRLPQLQHGFDGRDDAVTARLR